MLFRMAGIVRRGGQWIYRRRVPQRLRSIIGSREIRRTLDTSDLTVAQRRWQAVHAEVGQMFAEAEKAVANPSVAAYKAVEQWRKKASVVDDDREDSLDIGILNALEKDGLDPVQRSVLEALLKRRSAEASKDNPPLSLVFDRYKNERRPSAKTWREFDRALRGFTETVGDLPVRSIQKEHVRAWKQALLTAVSKRDGKSPVRAATVQKLLNVLRAVLEWANREGIVDTNPAHGVSRVAALTGKADTVDERRMPFTVEQARDILSRLNGGGTTKLPAEGPMRWVWAISLYTGARVSEIIGLRREDVRQEDGVLVLDIRPHAGRSLKTKASRRLVPVHPVLLEMGFKADLLPFRGTGHYWSKGERLAS
jgi:uncharacterized protein DUF6538/integrase-like protein